ncbi:MAG: MATE family efflux transporter [Sarcina sp.]
MENEYFFKEAPIKKAINKLAIPMMIGMSVATIYGVINAYFIGLLHNTAMFSAITFGMPVFIVLMAIGNVFGAGGGTFISRLVGEGNKEKCRKVAGYTFYSSIICGIVVGVIAIIFAGDIAKLLGANTQTFLYTKQYVIALFAGGFTIVLNFTLEQLVRAEGASKESMYGVVVSSLASLVLDPLLILYFDFNVMGAAIATVLANLAAVIYYIYYLEKKSANLSGFLKHYKISLSDRLEIYKVGIGELFQAVFLLIVSILMNNFAIEYGDNVVTGFGIALRITQVPEFLAMGVFLGLIPLFAYNFSAKNIKRFNEALKHAMLYIGIILVVFCSITFILRDYIIRIFTNSPAVIEVGIYILAVMLIASLFNGFTGLFISIFQATGQGFETIVMSTLQATGYIIAIIVLHYFFGLHGIIWSMAVTEIIMCIIGGILFIRFKRKKVDKGV